MADISVIILTYQRHAHLRGCLRSLAAADLGPVREMLVAVNGEDPESQAILESWTTALPSLRVLQLPRSSRGAARNAAVAQARGAVLYFLDDDVAVAPDLFRTALRLYEAHPQAWGVGGPNITPPQSSPFQKAGGRVLECRLGAWSMRSRYASVGAERWEDDKAFMLCNLSLRRPVFSELGLKFHERVVSAEENLLIGELGALGRRLLYAPQLKVHHERRAGLQELGAQVFKCGAGRGQVARLRGRSLSIVFALPSLFLLYLLALVLTSPRAAAFLPLTAYAAAVGAEAVLYFADGAGLGGAARLAFLLPFCHVAYGAGFLRGALSLPQPEGRAQSAGERQPEGPVPEVYA